MEAQRLPRVKVRVKVRVRVRVSVRVRVRVRVRLRVRVRVRVRVGVGVRAMVRGWVACSTVHGVGMGGDAPADAPPGTRRRAKRCSAASPRRAATRPASSAPLSQHTW